MGNFGRRLVFKMLISTFKILFKLRCLLKNNVDILKSDGEGRTPVHYAALYGSIDCLKVFKEYHVDLKITDHNGANACHHATSGGHVNCLKYLTKVGLPFEAKDKSAKTSAHYVRCRHLIWLITGKHANESKSS